MLKLLMATWRKNFPQLSQRGLYLANPCTEMSPEFFRLTVLYPLHTIVWTQKVYTEWVNCSIQVQLKTSPYLPFKSLYNPTVRV